MNNDFLVWEQFSRDTIDVKRVYIDIAGDLISGILLSQIIFWNLPNQQGKTKLRITKENSFWLAKGRSDWWEECRITPKQFDRAIKILETKNLVEKKVFKFNGNPTLHIKLNLDSLTQCLSVITQRGITILTKGEEPYSPLGNIDIDQRGISLTEITTKITTEITNTSSSKKTKIENKEKKIDDDEIKKISNVLKDKKKGSLEIAPKDKKQENPNCDNNINKNIQEIQELVFNKLKTKISDKQAEILLSASNNDIERLNYRIDVATTQTINNVMGWLIDALKRPDEQYKVISTVAKKNIKRNNFTNIESHKRDWKEIERLESEYIKRKNEGN